MLRRAFILAALSFATACVKADKDEDDDDESDWGFCVFEAADTCVDVLSGWSLWSELPCEQGGGDWYEDGDCPRENAVACCYEEGDWLMTFYASEPPDAEEEQAMQQSCEALGGEWLDC